MADETVLFQMDDILHAILERIREGVCLLNESGEIIDINPSGLDIMETTREECMDLQFGDAFHCENSLERGCGHGRNCRHCPVRKNLEAAIMEDSFSSEFTVKMHSVRRNRGVWLKLRVSRVKVSEGNRIVVVLEDDTANKDFERQLETARTAAGKAKQVNLQVLTKLSCQIRTAVNGLAGMMELAAKEPLTENQQSCLENAQQCADGLLRCLDEALDAVKGESGGRIEPASASGLPALHDDEDEVARLMQYCLHKLEDVPRVEE
ncbi:MAG: PAS domain-containing protein [Selenomonas sp.]|uniref:histidine kinase dimerization/phospho-acceptor domain-containing protein n=1 Tax=Selenomonas sp. TaxID=2053611 RepID=UPI0025E2D094|nr:histidine kinase dimerization/phospho-acceptor domain-containing protein [Selenomonas sp.]MCR5440190.1 PAS domain-containing protein [Selenomonas sp.]